MDRKRAREPADIPSLDDIFAQLVDGGELSTSEQADIYTLLQSAALPWERLASMGSKSKCTSSMTGGISADVLSLRPPLVFVGNGSGDLGGIDAALPVLAINFNGSRVCFRYAGRLFVDGRLAAPAAAARPAPRAAPAPRARTTQEYELSRDGKVLSRRNQGVGDGVIVTSDMVRLPNGTTVRVRLVPSEASFKLCIECSVD